MATQQAVLSERRLSIAKKQAELELLGQRLDAVKEKWDAIKDDDEADTEPIQRELEAIHHGFDEMDADRERRRIMATQQQLLKRIAFLTDRNRVQDFTTNQVYYHPKWFDGLVDNDFDDDDYGLVALNVRLEWFDNFLTAFNWWQRISEALLEHHDPRLRLAKPCPHCAPYREKLQVLTSDVLAAYLPAMQSGPYYTADWEGAQALENAKNLLKAYWAYRCYVCDFARELLPEITVDSLLKLA